MSDEYGPLEYFIGKWTSAMDGENRAPDSERGVENTKFRQETHFEPIPAVENHEQELAVLRYKTMAWEEGNDDEPFHEEVGYFIWDEQNKQLLKSFVIPRGVSVNAGGTIDSAASTFEIKAEVGSDTYGVCSNQFLDKEFKTVSYELKISKLDENSFSYDENTRLQIKGQDQIFDHTEKNVMKRV